MARVKTGPYRRQHHHKVLKITKGQFGTRSRLFRRANEAMLKSNQRLDLLAETASQLLKSDSPQKVVNVLCRKVLDFLECDAFFNYLVDDEEKRLHLNACGGIPEEDARKMEWLDYGVGLCGCSARDGCRLVVEDVQETKDQYTALVRPFGIKAYACHPLMSQGRVIGTLAFGTRSRNIFNHDDLAMMETVTNQVATAPCTVPVRSVTEFDG